ncbi:MAG: CAAX prenyl protease-related protein [Planctomycetaceae bacterium]
MDAELAPAATPGDRGPASPWLVCVVPFAVFLAAGVFEPVKSGGGLAGALGIPYAAYPLVYALRLGATLAALAWCGRPLAAWIGRPTWWPPLLGLALVVPWVALAVLQREAGWATLLGERSAFDPFTEFGAGTAFAWGFLALRLVGLVVVVSIVEELFLRGFVMRYVVNEDFWQVPFGLLVPASAAACAVYAALTHPAEAVAAVGWFAVVSGIAAATRKPIDCILAHAATNLALGVYVVQTGAWWLW